MTKLDPVTPENARQVIIDMRKRIRAFDRSVTAGNPNPSIWRAEATKRLKEAEAVIKQQRELDLMEDQDCLGKEKYPSESAVRAALATFNAHRGRPDTRMEPYPCVHCGHYHLGHPPTRLVRNKQLRKPKGRRAA